VGGYSSRDALGTASKLDKLRLPADSVRTRHRVWMLSPVAMALLGTLSCACSEALDSPPRGWSSWNSFKLNINEEVVRGAADVMADKLLPAGYEYLLIDDGWPPDSAHYNHSGPARLPDGTIPVSSEKFPSGFKNLTGYIHSKGLKIGIYTAVSHWTCGGYTGSLGHEELDAKTFVEWGFDFVKHDTCGGYNGEPANECGVGALGGGNCIRNSTTKMSAALKKYGAAAGKEIVYYIDHGNPTSPQRLFNPHQRFVSEQSDAAKLAITPNQLGWTWAAEVCHMMKTTFDTRDSWESMLTNLHSTVNLPTYQRHGYFNMPDMLSIGQGGQTQAQYRAQMLLWSVMGAPLILGADIRHLDEFSTKLVTAREVLAVNADPDCVQGSLLRSRGSYEIWGKPLRNRVDTDVARNASDAAADDPAFAVVLFNKGTIATNVTLHVAGTGDYGMSDFYPAGIDGPYHVRDLLQQQDVATAHLGPLTTTVPPTDAVMLQIRRATPVVPSQ